MMTSVKRLSKLIYGALLIPWGIPVYIAVPPLAGAYTRKRGKFSLHGISSDLVST